MPRELSAQDREDLTPGELAAIMGDNTEEAAAEALADKTAETVAAERAAETANDKVDETPELDDEGQPVGKPEQTPEEIAAAAAAAQAAAKTDEPNAEELAALLEDDETPQPAAPKPVTYKGISEDAYKTEAAKLNAEKAQAMKDLMDGTIDAEAYAKIESEVADKRDDLVANRTLARANAEALEQANAAKASDFQTSIAALMKASQGQAVDYNTDARAQRQFDDASRLIASDPDNQHLTPQQVCDQAHATVLALRGIVAKAAAPAQAPAAATTKAPAVKTDPPPVTLGGLPSAAPNQVTSDLKSQFARLEGEEAEEFLERLPKAQRQALLAGGMV